MLQLLRSPRGTYDLIANTEIRKQAENFTSLACSEFFVTSIFCEIAVNSICGFNRKDLEMDRKILENIYRHVAHSVSVRQFEHYFQSARSGGFRQFDFKENNTRIYNSTSPPSYNLKRITVKAYIYSGLADSLVANVDIDHLEKVLPNVRLHKKFKNYNHCDFNYGKNSRTIVYENILKIINAEAMN